VPLALDVGFPGIRSCQNGAVWPFELGQVPAQALVAAYHPSPAWPDYDESLVLQGLQRAARGLAADVVVARYLGL